MSETNMRSSRHSTSASPAPILSTISPLTACRIESTSTASIAPINSRWTMIESADPSTKVGRAVSAATSCVARPKGSSEILDSSSPSEYTAYASEFFETSLYVTCCILVMECSQNKGVSADCSCRISSPNSDSFSPSRRPTLDSRLEIISRVDSGNKRHRLPDKAA